MCRRFVTLCSNFIRRLNKSNNPAEMAGIFIQVKVWLKKSVGPPPDWPTLLLNEPFTCINTPVISSQLLFLLKRPTKLEQCSETSTHRIQKTGNPPPPKKKYSIRNAAKVSNQENLDVLEIIKKKSTRVGNVLWNDVSSEKWT